MLGTPPDGPSARSGGFQHPSRVPLDGDPEDIAAEAAGPMRRGASVAERRVVTEAPIGQRPRSVRIQRPADPQSAERRE
jgi:hypothetical protein